MMQAGFESQPPDDPARQPTLKTPAQSGAWFVPPLPEELAPRFPQLEMLGLLGQGGMGAVYKARQIGLDRLVALKILPPEVNQDEAFAERFTREARALAKLSHPNIVAVYDFGQTDGMYFLVMEYVDGVNLRQSLQAGELKPTDALAIVPQICDALQFAHDEGIVHRDIKPENILVDKRGRVKIADFGLAKLLGHDHAVATLTGTHQVMGTLKYMAPEQMEGAREVDHRADIYSLGVVFYEMLTGELPLGRFAAPSKKVEIDVRLDDVVLRTLEKEPERRYQHASDVKTEVEAIRHAPSVMSTTAGASVADAVLFRRLTVINLLLITLATASFCGLQAGYLSGADWFFKWELPRLYLDIAWFLTAGWSFVYLAWWWYLLAKDPQTPRTFGDFWRVLQTPDPRNRKLWLPAGVFLGASTLATVLAFSISEYDAVHTIVVSLPFIIGPYALMAVLWNVFGPAGQYRDEKPPQGSAPLRPEAFQPVRPARNDTPQSTSIVKRVSRSVNDHWQVRVALLVTATLGGYAALKLLSPDFSDAMWMLVILTCVLGFAVEVIRSPGTLRSLQAAFALLGAAIGLLTYLFVAPEQELDWIYEISGGTPGRDDPILARLLIGFAVAWLIAQMVQVRRRITMAKTQPIADSRETPTTAEKLPAHVIRNGVLAAALVVLIVGALVWLTAVGVNTLISWKSSGTSTDLQRDAKAGARATIPRPAEGPPESQGSRRGWQMGPGGPALTDSFATYVLKVDSTTRNEVDRVLQSIHRESLKLEQSHWERRTDQAGHIVTTIREDPTAVAALEDQLWSQLDAILSPEQQKTARLNLQLHPLPVHSGMELSEIITPGLFGWSEQGATVEVWRVGTWFHWNISTRYFKHTDSAPQLPMELRRFWEPQ
jgi:predicted Ser/Thr protein kinase